MARVAVHISWVYGKAVKWCIVLSTQSSVHSVNMHTLSIWQMVTKLLCSRRYKNTFSFEDSLKEWMICIAAVH